MTTSKPLKSILFLLFTILVTACVVEDPGPRQETERQYTVVDFNRLEIGSGLHIQVEHDNFYSVTAKGDRRNIEDLVVRKEGSTLLIQYRNYRERRHDTYITITTPQLVSVNFSGGSESRVDGFTVEEKLDVYLSGGSVCQMNLETSALNVVLSGASYLNVRGSGEIMDADISGASVIRAFDFVVIDAGVVLYGASAGEVTVTETLDVIATGASHLVYRGDPMFTFEVSASSDVRHE